MKLLTQDELNDLAENQIEIIQDDIGLLHAKIRGYGVLDSTYIDIDNLQVIKNKVLKLLMEIDQLQE